MKRLTSLAALFLCLQSGVIAADSLQLDAHENLFYVMAAINAAGYDDGIRLPDNSQLRMQLREYLAAQDIPVLPELKRYFQSNGRRKTPVQDLSQYISYALSVTGPPDFGWKTRDVEVPPDAKACEGLTPLLIDFFRQARLDQLWRRSQPVYERELEKYHTPILNMTNKVDGYLRAPAAGYLGRRFQVYIDLLAAPQQVQARNYGDDALVIVTPSEQPKMYDIRHTYLHYQVDPIVIKYGIDLQQKRSLLDLVQLTPLDDSYKNDFVLLSNESLIRAIESRLDKNPAAVDMAMKQGYVMTQYFAEQLPGFEQQQQGMRFYLEDIVKGIDLKTETARISNIKFDSGQLQRKAKQIVTSVEPERSASAKTLDQAEAAYSSKVFDKAKQLFLKSLEQKGSEEEHSQAWFGLGRIAALEKQPDAAVKLFDKALTSSPDAFTKGWSYVYLARLAKAANEPEKAAKYYQQALAVPGASDKVLEAARKESQTINQEISK
ncbi:MAG TPA: tetratricopeptide repeat protein [Bryobacteraceae bacterium]|nr:tetratricopeptide repeat protein [Bryobacteraceae bacterium]